MKSNKSYIDWAELKNKGPKFDYNEAELDFVEKSIFGDVRKVPMDFYFKEKILGAKNDGK